MAIRQALLLSLVFTRQRCEILGAIQPFVGRPLY